MGPNNSLLPPLTLVVTVAVTARERVIIRNKEESLTSVNVSALCTPFWAVSAHVLLSWVVVSMREGLDWTGSLLKTSVLAMFPELWLTFHTVVVGGTLTGLTSPITWLTT